MKDEIKEYLILLIEEFGDMAIDKIADKLDRIHRGNAINIIRSWSDELSKLKYPKDQKKS